ncbi:MAG: hypothetical protein DI534_14380 [Leifsonia xyli]|nr:MAG: hypothetical protein DI534_14380 [Leifsonia xyli]
MEYAELLNTQAHTSVRVWWAQFEVRISAVLGVPYEASDEVITDSLQLIGDVVFALCSGRYLRSGGTVQVTVGKKVVSLTEWRGDPISLPG